AIGTLQLEIRQTAANGFPVNDPAFLIQTTTPMSTLPQTGPAFVSFDLSSFGLELTPGEKLAIVLFVLPGGSSFVWSGTAGNPYPAGSAFEEQPPNHGWVDEGTLFGYDLGFRTFVNTTPTAVPEPSAWLSFGLGTLGLIGHAWRRRRGTCSIARAQ